MNSSNTKVLKHLCNLAKRVSIRIVTLTNHVAGSPYLGSVNVSVLHHGENTAKKPFEESDAVLQLLKLFIVTLEAIVVSGIRIAQTFKCQL